MKVNIAVIGCGYWGKNLIRNYSELDSLYCVCDNDTQLAQSYAVKYGVKALTWTEVLQDPEVTAVVIATPADQHANLAKEAIIAGKDVYVEKPLALSVSEAKHLCHLAEEKQRILMVGHLLQYHPAFTKLKELVFSGELGRLQYIYSNRLNLGIIRREEDLIWSLAPHDISMILSLVNELPNEVYATGGYFLHGDIADVTTTHLTFPSGVQSQIFVSWLHPFKEQKLVVVGSKGMAVFDDCQTEEDKLLVYPHEITWSEGIPVPHKAQPRHVSYAKDEPLKEECKHFIESIVNRTPPLTDGHEGVRVLSVLSDATKVLQTNKLKKQPGDVAQYLEKNNYFVHDTACIDDGVQIGEGSKIWHYTHVQDNAHIGDSCILGQNVMIGPNVKIGDRCKIQNNVSVYEGVTLDKGVFCGPSSVFTNVKYPRATVERKSEFQNTYVGEGSTIGANATIMCGISIGKFAFIAAGAVVTKDVKPYSLMVGSPAQHKGWVSDAGEVLGDSLICPRTGTQYVIEDNNLCKVEIVASSELK